MLHAQRLRPTHQVSVRTHRDDETRFSQVLESVLMVTGVGSMAGIAAWAWILQIGSLGPF
ncbi:MAG: hypothetical protein O9327_10545 [Polaromonas sp.]|nr:hypothetical protein [Polaromonas sp.]